MSIELSADRPRETSMEDVARVAGVSAQTVSRVVRNKGYVGAATREKVQAAMAELGYRPNSAARALRSGRFHAIGVIMFSLSSYGNMRTLDAIASRAAQAGYALTLIPVETVSQSTVTGAFNRLTEHAVDGIVIIIEAHELNGAELEIPDGLPVVVVDSTKRGEHAHIDTDQARGARQATEHLLSLGHETVWHVSGPDESYSAERRREAWRRTLVENDRAVPAVITGDWSADSGYAAGVQLREHDDVTAIFAASDAIAIGLIRAFHEAGISVPERVSIVGFDDIPEAANLWPPLTTISQDFAAVGERAVDALMREIDGETDGEAPPIATRLIERASTAAPRG